MADRRSRGTRRSSNCFQTSSAFGFLVFIGRSREEDESTQLTARDRVNGKGLAQRARSQSAEVTEKKLAQKEKGRNRGCAQLHPRYDNKVEHFCNC
jgi:hypothetical protein